MATNFDLKRLLKYMLMFTYFFVCLSFIYTLSRGDLYVNYGFSYAISIGEVPYRDFNLVILPFAPLLYSAFLIIFRSIICYYLGQAFLLTLFSYFIFKILGGKSWLYFAILLMPFPIAMVSVIFPGYNFLLLFIAVIIVYCEKNNKSDYLIGFLLGLGFVTKQTVGGLLCFASIYYLFGNYKKVLKRMVGFFVPVLFCLIYLLFSHSLRECFDLCFLGLFDFGHDNFSYDSFYLTVFIIAMITLIYKIIRKPKNIVNYYVLLFSSCVYPLIDYYHVSLFLAFLVLIVLSDFNLSRDISKYCIAFILSVSAIWMFIEYAYLGRLKITNYNNLELSIFSESYVKSVNDLDQYIKKQDREVIYFLRGSENYFYKIKGDLKITYFDLPNYGNYGYNGTLKIIKRLNNLENVLIVIDKSCYLGKNKFQQYIKEAAKYIIDNGELVEKIGNYEVYYIK